VIDPENPRYAQIINTDTVTTVAGEVESGKFILLERGKDYDYDNARGFFWLSQAVQDKEILAVAYKTDNDHVGTLFSDVYADTSRPFIMRLIKPQTYNRLIPKYGR
jgi:hypothetical protein